MYNIQCNISFFFKLMKILNFLKLTFFLKVMKMMGLSNGVHWVAWFINAFTLMFISSILLVIILKVSNIHIFYVTDYYINSKYCLYLLYYWWLYWKLVMFISSILLVIIILTVSNVYTLYVTCDYTESKIICLFVFFLLY